MRERRHKGKMVSPGVGGGGGGVDRMNCGSLGTRGK